MAIGVAIFQLIYPLWKKGVFNNFKTVVEFGAQDIYFPEVKQLITLLKSAGFALPKNNVITTQMFYDFLGFKIYKCIDADGHNNALVFDINKDFAEEYNYREKFDLVTNLGTIEHCFNQYNGFKNAHNLCATNGIMLHYNCFQGNVDHGFYNYQPCFFIDLAKANNYQILGIYCNCYKNGFPREYGIYPYSEKLINLLSPDTSLDLFIIFKKTKEQEFRTPFQDFFSPASRLNEYEYNRSIELDSDGNNSNFNDDIKPEENQLEQTQEKLEKTVEHCYEAIQIQPNFAEHYQALGNALQTQGKIESAVRAYSKALQINPGLAEAYYYLAKVLCLVPGSLHNLTIIRCWDVLIEVVPDLAMIAVREAIAVKPDWVQPYFYLGNMLLFWEGAKRRGIRNMAER